MVFDLKRHVIKVQGREYLPVAARLVWFRSEHPDWGIVTTPVEINLEKQYAIFSASIFNEDGKLMATATKMENVRGFPDWLEKSETGAVGRALAFCGYGTQFAPELEEGNRFSDASRGGGGNRFASSGPSRNMMNNSSGGGEGNGGGMQRPGPIRNAVPAPAPTSSAPPRIMEQDAPFTSEPPPPVSSAPPAAPRNNPAPQPPVEARANTGNGGGITRVREPERDLPDPGGMGDEDEEDPFGDDEPMPSPPARATNGARPEAPRPAPIASDVSDAPPASPRPNVLAGNNCSVDGCPNVLTASQMTMSTNKFGRPLCLIHQREAQPIGAAAGAGANGSARRSTARSDDQANLL